MNEPFELPVTYKENELMLPARLVQTGYTYRFEVVVNDEPAYFEPDEEGALRVSFPEGQQTKEVDVGLLQAIVEAIAVISK